MTKMLIRLRRCAGWSASLLFAYGKNRFSHDMAHLYIVTEIPVFYGNSVQHINVCQGPINGQLDAPSRWYSGGRRFNPRSGHISFIEIWLWNNFYSHSLPNADSSWAVVSYWWNQEHSVMVNCLASLPRNSVDRLTDQLSVTVTVLTWP